MLDHAPQPQKTIAFQGQRQPGPSPCRPLSWVGSLAGAFRGLLTGGSEEPPFSSGTLGRREKRMRKEITMAGREEKGLCPGHLLPFPSQAIPGLTAIPMSFLLRLAGNRCTQTDVSFRNCDLFMPIPEWPLPARGYNCLLFWRKKEEK